MVGRYLTPGKRSVLGARTLPFDYMPPKQGNFPSKKTHKKRLKMPKISKRFLLTPSPPLTARTAVGCCLSTCLSGSDPFLAFYCQIQDIPLNAPQAHLSQQMKIWTHLSSPTQPSPHACSSLSSPSQETVPPPHSHPSHWLKNKGCLPFLLPLLRAIKSSQFYLPNGSQICFLSSIPSVIVFLFSWIRAPVTRLDFLTLKIATLYPLLPTATIRSASATLPGWNPSVELLHLLVRLLLSQAPEALRCDLWSLCPIPLTCAFATPGDMQFS